MMKKAILLLAMLGLSQQSNSQNLAYTEWFGTHSPSPNLWFYFGPDTLYYSFTGSGFTAMSVYRASAGVFAIFDLTGASLCTDTGHYNYTIASNHLIFTVITDNCANRRNTLTNYNWTLLSTGIDEKQGDIFWISPNPTTGSFNIKYNSSALLQVTIQDMAGKEVFIQVFDQLSLRSSPVAESAEVTVNTKLRPGIYFVRVSDGKKIATQKLVVQ